MLTQWAPFSGSWAPTKLSESLEGEYGISGAKEPAPSPGADLAPVHLGLMAWQSPRRPGGVAAAG
jgi:hypothetical protein